MITRSNRSQQALADCSEVGAATTLRASLIIVNYNGGDDLQNCLQSLDPAHDASTEIILVDNASTDGSADEIARCFPDVRIIRSTKNLGFGAAGNLGARHARGDYLAFLNPDTLVTPGWLSALIDALEGDPRAGLATPKILLAADLDRINACGNDVHCTGITLCRGAGQDAKAFKDPAQVSAVSGAAFVIRRHLFQQLNGFDPDYFMYFEDTDLSLRARLLGYQSLYVPNAVVHHRYRLRFGSLKTYFEERNRYVTLLKLLRWPTMLLMIPIWFLGELVTWGFVLLLDRPRWPNKLKAYAHVWQNRRHIRSQRRQWQALRRVRDRSMLREMTYRLDYEQTGAGLVSNAAHLLFDPLFFAARQLVLALIRW